MKPLNGNRRWAGKGRGAWVALSLFAVALMTAGGARAQVGVGKEPAPRTADEVIKNVGLDQKLNAQIPLHLSFRDEAGKDVQLSRYFGTKPVMLILIQYRCTMLCTTQMTLLMESLKQLQFDAGNQFHLLTVSIDPRETPSLAAETKQNYLKAYGRPGAASGWNFLTGEERSIKQLAASVGFRYAYDAKKDEFAHPDGVILLTPEGKIARYFFRLEYPAQGLRFGLIEAAKNRIGSPLDYIALMCYHYNPETGTYGVAILKVVRLAGLLTVLLMAFGIVMMKRRERPVKWRVSV